MKQKQATNKQLTEEIVAPAKGRQVCISILGTLIFVLLANFVARWYLKYNTTNRGYLLIREKWELLLAQKQPVDWLILGDSSCNQGVVPSILEKRLGGTSINLCTLGDLGGVDDAWMVDLHLQKLGSPKNIVIVHVYDVWHREGISRKLLAKIPLSWGYWEELQPPMQFSPRAMLDFLLLRYVPLLKENQTLSEVLRSPVHSFQKSRRLSLDANGFMAYEEPRPKRVENDKNKHIKFVRKNKFKMSVPNRQALEQIVALAQEYGFNVYLVNSPIYQDLYNNEDYQAYFSQVQNTLSAYAAKSKKVYYIREPMVFSKEEMENADHLVYPAAKVYTDKLASEIDSIRQARDESR
ncbi:MAG: hypothetical protein SXA11_17050 [Cyanobacteriota bacterium]|nr:hypothetical protein [Cyanobacteriota bacterium]